MLNIEISKKKDHTTKICISKANISASCDQLLYAYKKKFEIKHFIPWTSLIQTDIINLIYSIGLELFLKSSNLFDLLVNQQHGKYTMIEIYNLEFFMNMIFYNKLMLKKLCFDEIKWKLLMIRLKRILLHQQKSHDQLKYESLALLLVSFQKYWNLKHFAYFINIEFHKALLHSVYISFWRGNRHIINSITFGLLYNCRRKLEIENNEAAKWCDFQNQIHNETKIYKNILQYYTSYNQRFKNKERKKNIKYILQAYNSYINELLLPVRLRMPFSFPTKIYDCSFKPIFKTKKICIL